MALTLKTDYARASIMNFPFRHRVIIGSTKAAVETAARPFEVQGWAHLGEPVLVFDRATGDKPYWALALRWEHDFAPLELASLSA